MPRESRVVGVARVRRRVSLGAIWVLVLALAACGTPGGGGAGPEAAAKQGLQAWATGNSVAYRNEVVTVGVTGKDFANVEVVAELPVAGSADAWLEQRAFVQVQKANGTWQPPLEFKFELTTNAVATQTAGVSASATARTVAAGVTRTAAAYADQTAVANRGVTATAYSQGQVATATAYAQDQAATATAVTQNRSNTATAQAQSQQATQAAGTQNVQRTATARAQATGTAVVALRPTITAASADFNGQALPTGWQVTRPDPVRMQLTGELLRYRPVAGIDFGKDYNLVHRALPSKDTDLDIIIKLRAVPKKGEAFWLELAADTNKSRFFEISITNDGNGPVVKSYAARYQSQKSVVASGEGDLYLKVERRNGGKEYTAFFSRDGVTWTFVNEAEVEGLTLVGFCGISPIKAGTAPSDKDFIVDVYWVRFEVPK